MINSISEMRDFGKYIARITYTQGNNSQKPKGEDVMMDREDLTVFINALQDELEIYYNIDGAGDVEEQYQIREIFYQ